MDAEDLRYFSPQVMHREHSPGGQVLMLQQIYLHFDLFGLRGAKRWEFRLADLVYLNQIHHATAYKTAAEHFRRWRSRLNETSGEGLTMCALYWQLNDIWQGVSLSGIDYGMKWKFLHYYAKNFFAPILISPYVDSGYLRVSVVSDLLEAKVNCTFTLKVITWNNLHPSLLYNFYVPLLKAATSAEIYSVSVEKLRSEIAGGENPENLFLIFETSLYSADRQLLARNVLFPDEFYKIPPDNYGSISLIRLTQDKPRVFNATIRATRSPAVFVWLNVKGVKGYFSDNGFHVLSDGDFTVQFFAWYGTVTIETVRNNLEITTLRDLYFDAD